MLRFVFLMLAAACALRAVSFSTATCTLGTTTIISTSNCSIPFVNPDGTSGFIEADASVSLQGSSGTVGADAGAGPPGVTPPSSWDASASAGDTETFTTPGPPRMGLISILLESSGEEGGEGSVSVDGFGCGGTGFCNFGMPDLPFELGVPFTISLSASASGACGAPPGCPQGGASYDFTLSEADGTTPVSLISIATPEPSTFGLPLLSLIAWAAALRSRPRCSLRSRAMNRLDDKRLV
jgi:hypothetical protein